MSNTYTGTLDTTPGFTSQPGQFFPDDRQGTLVEIDSFSGSVDNIFYYDSLNTGKFLKRIINGSMRAIECGIYANGTDQTTWLQTVINNTDIKTLVFDDVTGGTILINGTLTVPEGKTLRFESGNILGGTGTINGGIIDAGLNQQIFDPTLGLRWNPEGVSGNVVSATWAGASEGISDNAPLFQVIIDMVIVNLGLPRNIYFPPGRYTCDQPIIIYYWDDNNYIACSANLIGQDFAHATNVTEAARLVFNSTETFGIGVQRGYSCLIKGLVIEGPFNPSFESLVDFYRSDFDTYADGVRDSPFSPLAGIVIDPFSFGGYMPPDGGYPGFNTIDNNWYRGSGPSTAGSSNVTVSECRVSGFTVDYLLSPNGMTEQGENCIVHRCVMEVCKVAMAYGQRQTKSCVAYETRHWDRVHTVIDTQTYGNTNGGSGTPPAVYTMDIAGTVKRLFFVTAQHPVVFDNIYCETLGEIGILTCFAGTITVSNCNFSLNLVLNIPEDPTPDYYVPDYHVAAINTKFSGCTIRYYDDLFNKRLYVKGLGNIFDNCFFDLPPLTDSPAYDQSLNIVVFRNCRSGNAGDTFFGTEQYTGSLMAADHNFALYGKMQFTDLTDLCKNAFTQIMNSVQIKLNVANYQGANLLDFSFPTVTVDPATATATFVSPYAPNLALGQGWYAIIVDGAQHTNKIIGRITAINTGTNTITVSDVPYGTVSGTYALGFTTFSYVKPAFICDVISGTNILRNVEYSNAFSYTPYQVGDQCPLMSGTITAINTNPTTGEKTITGTINAGATATGVYVGFGQANNLVAEKYEMYSLVDPSDPYCSTYAQLIPTGAIWINTVLNKKFFFKQGGYLNAAAQGFIHQARYIEIDPQIVMNEGSADFSIVAPAGFVLIGWTMLSTTGFTITAGTTNGATDIDIGTPLTANQTAIFSYLRYNDAGFTIYFNGITGSAGTTTIRLILQAI